MCTFHIGQWQPPSVTQTTRRMFLTSFDNSAWLESAMKICITTAYTWKQLVHRVVSTATNSWDSRPTNPAQVQKYAFHLASFQGQREGGEKGPGFNHLCMCLIAAEFHRSRRPSIYVCILVTSKWILNVMWSVHLYMYYGTEYSVLYERSWSCSFECPQVARHSWSDV